MPKGEGFYGLDGAVGVAPIVVVIGRPGSCLTCIFRSRFGAFGFQFATLKGWPKAFRCFFGLGFGFSLGWALLLDSGFLGILSCFCFYLCTLALQVLYRALSFRLYFPTFGWNHLPYP
ncbi:uncharacterized protein LOC131303144 [Rhododendron vialii]|uniref:uncharacterized protein LOC131303144 n=1 Tax=Rhododendron vialii TaxID=182163 RepID=UPI00265F1B42|nr:uncharacterized protein LOC131303144 [Rhododendron vialii]